VGISSHKPQIHIALCVPTEQATRIRARPEPLQKEGISSRRRRPKDRGKGGIDAETKESLTGMGRSKAGSISPDLMKGGLSC
jgi:hypothetical protein